jgi:hypothetical protein
MFQIYCKTTVNVIIESFIKFLNWRDLKIKLSFVPGSSTGTQTKWVEISSMHEFMPWWSKDYETPCTVILYGSCLPCGKIMRLHLDCFLIKLNFAVIISPIWQYLK